MPLAAKAILTALIMATTSCGISKRPDVMTKIPVEYHKSAKSSTFLDSCLMTVALDATEHDAIIKKISRLIFTDNRIIVIDRYGNKIYVYGIRHNDDTGTELIAIDKKDLSSKPLVLHTCSNTVAGLFGFGKSIIPVEGGILACLPFDNRIYKISGGKASLICQLDFGSRAAKSLYDDLTYKEFLRKNDDHEWMVMNINVTDSLIQFNTNSYYSFIFNKTAEECHAFRGITTELLPFSCSKTIPTQGLKRQVVFEISNRSIKNYIHTQHHPNKEVDTAFINTIIDNNGNPTIIVWKER